ncbi:lipoprotein signal peptidase, partial [Ureaplasma urealyticum]
MLQKIKNSNFYIIIKKFNQSLRKINFFEKIILKINNKSIRDYFLSITSL